LLAVRYRLKDGHAPLLSGKSSNAYIVAGLESDHECSKLAEALEKLRKGMHIMIRQGTQEKNLQALVPLINEFNSFKLLTNFPLPIAGLMSDKPIESVIANLRKVNEVCKNLGNNVIRDPFMLLSFLSLSVLPSLKLTDKGLLDTERFQLVNLWVQY
jgi:adenine deaminase